MKKSDKSRTIKYAIVPAAGKGTRLLPITSVIPKELIPIGRKPMIHYVFERIIDSGISEAVVVISPSKISLKRYLKDVFSDKVKLIFAVQERPIGLADAISLCREFIGKEPFLLCMPDGFHYGDKDFIRRQIEVFFKTRKTTLGLFTITPQIAYLYGNCGKVEGYLSREGYFNVKKLGDKMSGVFKITDGTIAYRGMGISVCIGEFFDYIERYRLQHKTGELDDVPVFKMILKEKGLVGEIFKGNYIDAGNPDGLMYAQHILWEKERKQHKVTIKHTTQEIQSSFEMIVLGSGTAIPHERRFGPGYALKIDNRYILFDPSAGTLSRAVQYGIDLKSISHVFFTHLHPDHIGDLVPILFALRNPDLDSSVFIEIIGPPGFRNFYNRLKKVFGSWIKPPEQKARILEISESSFKNKEWDIKWERLAHTKESIGYRLIHRETGKVWAYSGDTEYCEGIIHLVNKADMAVLECSFPDQYRQQGHLTPSLAGRIAKKAGVRHLILSHFYPKCDEEDILSQCKKIYKGKITLASDYLRISI